MDSLILAVHADCTTGKHVPSVQRPRAVGRSDPSGGLRRKMKTQEGKKSKCKCKGQGMQRERSSLWVPGLQERKDSHSPPSQLQRPCPCCSGAGLMCTQKQGSGQRVVEGGRHGFRNQVGTLQLTPKFLPCYFKQVFMNLKYIKWHYNNEFSLNNYFME